MVEENESKKLKIFGDVDRIREGRIKSQYPSWYFRQHKDELEESIRHKRYMLENDLVPSSEKMITRERLSQEETRLNEINASEPKLTSTEKDKVANVIKELGEEIKSSMFTRSQMEKGVADPHEEARRITDPVIEIKSKEQAEIAEACGIGIRDGKISRGDAEKIWKIGRRLQGEISNTEILRKP